MFTRVNGWDGGLDAINLFNDGPCFNIGGVSRIRVLSAIVVAIVIAVGIGVLPAIAAVAVVGVVLVAAVVGAVIIIVSPAIGNSFFIFPCSSLVGIAGETIIITAPTTAATKTTPTTATATIAGKTPMPTAITIATTIALRTRIRLTPPILKHGP